MYLKLNDYYTDHLILQRDAENPISGFALPEETVLVNLTKDRKIIETVEKTADENGRWEIILKPYPAGTGYGLEVRSGSGKIWLNDVSFGDVYLLSGQSNIEFRLREEKNRDQAESLNNRIHIFTVPQVETIINGKEFPSFKKPEWTSADTENLSDFSAIGYYIGRVLEETGIPIGLVSCNKGGTSASCWISEESLRKDPVIEQLYLKNYWTDDVINQSEEEEDEKIRAYQQTLEDYNRKCEEYMILHPEASRQQMKADLGHTPWPGPKGKKDAGRPSGLYRTMFSKISGLPFRSVIWYQGEEDTKNGEVYNRLLPLLIEEWSEKLKGKPEFYIVQLPGYADEPEKKWPDIREAQRKAASTNENCHLITSLDCGESGNIHPEDKSVLGSRIGQAILKHNYIGERLCQPEIITREKTEGGMAVKFSEPVIVRDNSEGFRQTDKRTILVPEGLLGYAISNDPEVFLFTKDGLPVSPFFL